jgi:hypothetical protein
VEPCCRRLGAPAGGAARGEIRIENVEFEQLYGSFDQYWEFTREMMAVMNDALANAGEGTATEVRETVRDALGQFSNDEGALAIPASAVVASARAGANDT